MKQTSIAIAIFFSLILSAGVLCPVSGQTAQAQDAETDTTEMIELFDFSSDASARRWQAVNDGVMGGRSDGRFRIADGRLVFYGNLSLANNGGFASVRSRQTDLGLREGDLIVLRVRGDGRQYQFNLYTPSRRTAFSYRAAFETTNGEWTEVRIPIEQLQATSFGRVVSNMKLEPSLASGIGILLGDKREGEFQLEVEWIKVQRDNR